MKANELMIGDLVEVRGTFARVSELSDTGFFRARELVYNSTLHLSSDVIDASTNPIPLTEDILKANGFEHRMPYLGYHYYKDDIDDEPFVMEESRVYGLYIRIPYKVVKMRYVHELQHALRLCGLDELADNFKLGTTNE